MAKDHEVAERITRALERIADALEGKGTVTALGGGTGNGPPKPPLPPEGNG